MRSETGGVKKTNSETKSVCEIKKMQQGIHPHNQKTKHKQKYMWKESTFLLLQCVVSNPGNNLHCPHTPGWSSVSRG